MDRRVGAVLWAVLGVVVACWVVGTPRSAGPDEPSHLVAATAYMSGDFGGEFVPTDLRVRAFVVPGMVGAPDPVCWAFQPGQPVSCAGVPTTSDDVVRVSSSHDYAPWAYVLPGLTARVASVSNHAYLARLADALIPIVLVGLALGFVRRDGVAGPALLFGLTPIVWFSFGVVNPSGVAIAGGVALWAALVGRTERVHAWLAVSGWAALVLARRDGTVFAPMIVLAASALRHQPPSTWWHLLSLPMRALVVASSIAAVAVPFFQDDRPAEIALGFAPLLLVAVDVVWTRWRDASRTWRLGVTGATVVVGALGLVYVAVTRPRGWDPDVVPLILGATDDHLEGVVGVLGWLDTPSPQVTVLLFWFVVGGLLMLAFVDAPRTAAVAAGSIAAVVVAAWLLEFGQGDQTGTYWQARYSMPFVVGLPLAAVWRRRGRSVPANVGVALAVAFVVVVNGGFLAAQQRWAVGVYGTWAPWSWDTWGAPAPPVVLVALHFFATSALAAVVVRARPAPATAVVDPAVAAAGDGGGR